MSFSQIGGVGAGMMGAEIALCFARFGYEIIMADREESIVIHGKDRQAALLNKQVSRGKLTEGERDGILNRIQLTCDLSRLSDCDLVVEAVLEIPEVKSEVYRQLDASCKPACILASNTSSISITKLAAAVTRTRAGNFIGTHFNSPAGIMKMVEVVPGILTE